MPLPNVASLIVRLFNMWQSVSAWKKVSPNWPLPRVKTSRFLLEIQKIKKLSKVQKLTNLSGKIKIQFTSVKRQLSSQGDGQQGYHKYSLQQHWDIDDTCPQLKHEKKNHENQFSSWDQKLRHLGTNKHVSSQEKKIIESYIIQSQQVLFLAQGFFI